MTDNFGADAQAIPPQQPQVVHPPFPAARLLYSIGFGLLAYFVLVALFFLGFVQFVVFAINGRVNPELKNFSANLAQYLWELAGFIVFARDEMPFPLGPFPKNS